MDQRWTMESGAVIETRFDVRANLYTASIKVGDHSLAHTASTSNEAMLKLMEYAMTLYLAAESERVELVDENIRMLHAEALNYLDHEEPGWEIC